MSDQIGNITVPDIVASGTFGVANHFGYGPFTVFPQSHHNEPFMPGDRTGTAAVNLRNESTGSRDPRPHRSTGESRTACRDAPVRAWAGRNCGGGSPLVVRPMTWLLLILSTAILVLAFLQEPEKLVGRRPHLVRHLLVILHAHLRVELRDRK